MIFMVTSCQGYRIIFRKKSEDMGEGEEFENAFNGVSVPLYRSVLKYSCSGSRISDLHGYKLPRLLDLFHKHT